MFFRLTTPAFWAMRKVGVVSDADLGVEGLESLLAVMTLSENHYPLPNMLPVE